MKYSNDALLDLRLAIAGAPLDDPTKQYVIGLIDEQLKEVNAV